MVQKQRNFVELRVGWELFVSVNQQDNVAFDFLIPSGLFHVGIHCLSVNKI